MNRTRKLRDDLSRCNPNTLLRDPLRQLRVPAEDETLILSSFAGPTDESHDATDNDEFDRLNDFFINDTLR